MAITLADNAVGSPNDPPSSVAFNTSMSIGDVLVCNILLNENTSPGTQTVSDSINAGNWTLLNSNEDAGSSNGEFLYYKVATNTGTPTVSVSQSSAQYGHLNIARFTGFVGTPTVDSSAAYKFNGASTTAFSCTPVNSSFNNELLLAGTWLGLQSFTTADVTNWNSVVGPAQYGAQFYYAVVATSGTNNSFVATLVGATSWQAIFAGIYGAGGGATGTATIAWIT